MIHFLFNLGEFYSLKAIHLSVPSICPLPYCYGELPSNGAPSISEPTFYTSEVGMPPLPEPNSPLPETARNGTWFLLTDFISPLPSSTSSLPTQARLAYKLAKLHTIPVASCPGFPVTTYCGDTPQPNAPTVSGTWREFFAERRLCAVLERCPGDAEVRGLVGRICKEVIPRLLGKEEEDGEKDMVVVHGDLWSGNYMAGRIERVPIDPQGGAAEPEVLEGEFVFDSSACYGPPAYDYGIMNMFGGFGASFWTEYRKCMREFSGTTTDKRDEKGDKEREKLYELYHHLNHFAIFGGGYRNGAVVIMRSLLAEGGRGE
ncbi:Fructosamine/Ketosamine-3-kinase [Kalaharituber pfeilii]|nr:Fructosamine/Ketosamine-3-kinase [Kalaharituber pfeilii]